MADMEAGAAAGVSPASVAKGLIKFNPGYLTTPAGILKLVEFFLLMLSWALCSGFKNGYLYISVSKAGIYNYAVGAIGFFLFVTVTLWLVVVIVIILGLLSLMDKIRLPSKMLILAICHVVSAVFLLISTVIVAVDSAKFPGYWCDGISSSPFYSTTCATYRAAAAFGVFSCLTFVADAVVHFFNHRNQTTV